MDDRQKPIAAWMADVIERRRISARAWAERANLGKDTVSRALRPDYQSVTSTRTIAKLADAIDERPPGAAAAIPSVASLKEILGIFLTAYSSDRASTDDSVELFAEGLRETLLHLADEPLDALETGAPRTLARAAVRRLGVPTATH